ncbi:hypothetical protein [Cereibacter azotoformans]|uniref:hypothetical protein n=1 Tax=Cereibacter azotoformans TaxID=43057 RepID=UPI000C6DECCE|nr:hypothetical protein [Cereibacter azotoformans]
MRIFRTQGQKLWTVALAGAGACGLGVAHAVFLGVASDGGRGGAVAVALAFAALFTSTPAVQELIEAPDNTGHPAFDTLPPARQIALLRTALAEMQDRQARENHFLVFTSVLGTLVWAFGDVLASWLGAPS